MAPGNVALLLGLSLCLAAAWTDMKDMRIPNLLVLGGLVLFLLVAPFLGWDDVLWRLTLALPTFAVCFGLFALHLVGGGDAKFFPVMVLFLPPSQFTTFLLCFSGGLALALALLAIGRRLPGSDASGWRALRERKRFPMAVAFLLAIAIFSAIYWTGDVAAVT